jgi:hypothetical protein
MKIKAWIQMGVERCEVEFHVPDVMILTTDREELETLIKERVWAWVNSNFGWGMTCSLFTMDFTFNEWHTGVGQSTEALKAITTRVRFGRGAPILETLALLGLAERSVHPLSGSPSFRKTPKVESLDERQEELLDVIIAACPSAN